MTDSDTNIPNQPLPTPKNAERPRPQRTQTNHPNRPSKRKGRPNPILLTGQRMLGGVGLFFTGTFRIAGRFFRGLGSRKFKHLLQGFPSLLMFGGVVAVAMAVSLHRDKLIPTYQSVAEASSNAGKLDESLLYYRKLKSLNGGSPETRFAYAMDLNRKAMKTIEDGEELKATDQEDGENQIQYGQSLLMDARATIEEIAPLDGQGLPNAHLYQARRMLSAPTEYLVSKEGKLDSDGVKALEHHLLSAEKGLSDSIELQMAFFYYYLGMNQFREAADYLEKVAVIRPHLRYELTNLYFRLGDRKNALRNLTLASDYYERMVRENPGNHEMRARCATIRLNKRDLQGCIQMLEYGHSREKSEESPFPQLLAQTHVAVYDVLARDPKTPLEQRLAHLRAALSYVIDYQPALVRIIHFVAQPGEAGKEVEAYLQKMIAEGRMPATGQFCIGNKSLARQRHRQSTLASGTRFRT